MGDERTATRRLNLAQAFNPLGLVMGLLIAQQFVLKNLRSVDVENFGALEESRRAMIRTADLMAIRDPYVVLGLVVLGVLILIAVNKMPQAKTSGELHDVKETFSKLFRNRKYVLGVGSQVLYVGAQIMCWTYIYQYAEAINIPAEEAANFQFIAFIFFLSGRAIGTYLLLNTVPGKLLWIFGFFAAISTLGVIFTPGIVGLYCLVAISLFMSIMFPTIYGIALSGLRNDEAKIGAAGLVMAIVGGALMPALQGIIIDAGGVAVDDLRILGVPEVNISFILPLVCFVFISFYGNFVQRRVKCEMGDGRWEMGDGNVNLEFSVKI